MPTWYPYIRKGRHVPYSYPTGFLHRIVRIGFTLDFGTEDPKQVIQVTTFNYDEHGRVVYIEGPLQGKMDDAELEYHSSGDDEGKLEVIRRWYNDAEAVEWRFGDYHGKMATTVVYPNGRTIEQTYNGDIVYTVDSADKVSTTIAFTPDGKPDWQQLPNGTFLDYQYYIFGQVGTFQAVEKDSQPGGVFEFDGPWISIEADTGAGRKQTVHGSPLLGETYRTDEIRSDSGRTFEKWAGYWPPIRMANYGSMTEVIDQASNVERYYFLNEALEQHWQVLGLDYEEEWNVTSFTYDGQKNISSVIDGNAVGSQYEYDDFGCLVVEDGLDRGRVVYECLPDGKVSRYREANGVTTTYQRAGLDRIDRITKDDAQDEISFTWNINVSEDLVGQLVSFDSGETYTEKNKANLVTKKIETYYSSSEQHSMDFTYIHGGRTKSIRYPSGNTLVYSYGSGDNGRVMSVSLLIGQSELSVVNNIEYYPQEGPRAWQYGNGVAFSTIKDLGGRTDTISHGGLLNIDYSWTNDGNIDLAMVERLGNVTTYDYAYDETDRLAGFLSIDHTGSQSEREYQYRANGDRIADSQRIYTYRQNSSRLDQVVDYVGGAAQYEYDGIGQVTSDGRYEYEYNGFNRLARILHDGQVVADYEYNSKGMRISKTVDGVRREFVYGPGGTVYGEYSDDGFGVEYFYLAGSRIGMLNLVTDELSYIHNDSTGRTVAISNQMAEVIWKAEVMYPFGETEIAGDSSIEYNLLYPGQYYDHESGLVYNGDRYMDPSTGQYIQPDWASFSKAIVAMNKLRKNKQKKDVLNLIAANSDRFMTYAYAGNNPLSRIDRTGKLWENLQGGMEDSFDGNPRSPGETVGNLFEDLGEPFEAAAEVAGAETADSLDGLYGGVEANLVGGTIGADVLLCCDGPIFKSVVFIKVCIGASTPGIGAHVGGTTIPDYTCDFGGITPEFNAGPVGVSGGVDEGDIYPSAELNVSLWPPGAGVASHVCYVFRDGETKIGCCLPGLDW